MLKFKDLSLPRQRFVIAAIDSNPSLKSNPTITLKECTTLYRELKTIRKGDKNEKVGYPNWLFANNKVSRGSYELPLPSTQELSKFEQDLKIKLNPVKRSILAKFGRATAKVASASIAGAHKGQGIFDATLKSVDPDVEEFNAILRENGIELIS
jgi:hypothetical protein